MRGENQTGRPSPPKAAVNARTRGSSRMCTARAATPSGELPERRHPPPRDEQPGRAAGRARARGFGEHLSGEPRAARADAAVRTAISAVAPRRFASSRLATFTHAISSTNPTAASSARANVAHRRSENSSTASTQAPWPRFASGWRLRAPPRRGPCRRAPAPATRPASAGRTPREWLARGGVGAIERQRQPAAACRRGTRNLRQHSDHFVRNCR